MTASAPDDGDLETAFQQVVQDGSSGVLDLGEPEATVDTRPCVRSRMVTCHPLLTVVTMATYPRSWDVIGSTHGRGDPATSGSRPGSTVTTRRHQLAASECPAAPRYMKKSLRVVCLVLVEQGIEGFH
jgi:hypothetical protein